MAVQITETLELSRVLLKTFLYEGETAFKKAVNSYTYALLNLPGSEESGINSSLITIVSGILTVIYKNNSDKMVREQIKISENFVNESNKKSKVEIFVHDICHFLSEYQQLRDSLRFSDTVLEYLRTSSNEELALLTVETLASHFGYGQSRFLSKIKAETHKTVKDILSDERLSRAYLLLQENHSLTIKEVGVSVGFTDPVYFSRLFKKRYGFLPSEIRNIT